MARRKAPLKLHWKKYLGFFNDLKAELTGVSAQDFGAARQIFIRGRAQQIESEQINRAILEQEPDFAGKKSKVLTPAEIVQQATADFRGQLGEENFLGKLEVTKATLDSLREQLKVKGELSQATQKEVDELEAQLRATEKIKFMDLDLAKTRIKNAIDLRKVLESRMTLQQKTIIEAKALGNLDAISLKQLENKEAREQKVTKFVQDQREELFKVVSAQKGVTAEVLKTEEIKKEISEPDIGAIREGRRSIAHDEGYSYSSYQDG